MTDIINYLGLSEPAQSITTTITNPIEFFEKYRSVTESEQKSILSHFLVNNVPYVFRNNPVLFEQILLLIADRLAISASEIKLIGSAKTGFSISPQPNYGKNFSPLSDLDFSIINEEVFLKLSQDFNNWKDQYQSKIILPTNPTQLKYWDENITTCTRTISRGFIDTNKIPSYHEFMTAKKINNLMYLLKENLATTNSIFVKKSSVRVYKTWKGFLRQLKINTEYVLSSVDN